MTVALPEKFGSFDTLTTVAAPDASSERIRGLIFNSLVRKTESYDYVGELAQDIKTSDDGKVITFTLRDGVKFHNGQAFTSADVKYTFDELFKSDGKNSSFKSGAFFDTVSIGKSDSPSAAPSPTKANTASNPADQVKTKRVPHIISIETPDPKTVVFTIARVGLRNQLLSNLVAIPIVASGTAGQLKDSPIGSGPFKFISFDASQNTVELAANMEYWDGAPKIPTLRVKTVTDATSLQAELQTGGVDIAPNPTNLPPDMLKSISNSGNMKLDQFDGSNIQYLLFNTQQAPLNNPKIRQAIGYAIDRQKIVTQLLLDQARLAHSILPPESWAYSPGHQYDYDPAKAKQLIQEAGYKNEPIVFKYGSGNAAVSQYSQAIQNSLTEVGLTVQIETLDRPTIVAQLAQGQFQMYTGIWVGGNQDPIFLRNLFSSTMIPSAVVPCCNRGRYQNTDVDILLEDAMNEIDRTKAKELYSKSWQTISDEMPMLPLWYPANIVISNKRIGNI
ncbi:MAG: ABC transporter substrate-binding protein, partial [Acidobacteriota bacterium]